MEQVEAYLGAVPADRRAVLEHLRDLVRATCPEAIEVFGYQMPGFKYRGRPLTYFASFKDHLSLFAMGYAGIDRHRTELAAFDIRAGTIHFQPNAQLPDALVATMVRERMADIDAALAARKVR
jgi:uncharacterized protein YdhG (YjbR/CyaY superfamily)